jgi:hypothetical protein
MKFFTLCLSLVSLATQQEYLNQAPIIEEINALDA